MTKQRAENHPERPEQMLDWPGTPSKERLNDAIVGLDLYRSTMASTGRTPLPNIITITDCNGRESPFDASHETPLNIVPSNRQSRDVLALNDCITAHELYAAAIDLFQRTDLKTYRGGPGFADPEILTPRQWYSSALTQFVVAMATYGESERTVGIAWQQWVPQPQDKAHYVFTKLSRDPDWTGFNTLLEDLSDMKFVFHHSEDFPKQPGYIVGHPAQNNNVSEYRDNQFPAGPSSKIRDILTWHGAAECVWANSRL